jgi:hypothetical protein
MRALPLVLALSASLSAFAPSGATADGVGGGDGPSSDPGYVLHEWGTFTTVAGSDGVLLEGIHADDHALPGFVHSRDLSPEGFAGVRTKMETPVIYVYSDREREIRVKVRFPGGILTTWYPQVRGMSPSIGRSPPALKDGALDWGTVTVLAPGAGAETLRTVAADDPWSFARVPEANVLRVCGVDLSAAVDSESERYLFYRGLGRFDLPAQLRVEEGRVVLRCADLDPEAEARLVRVEGGRIRTVALKADPGTGGAVRSAALEDLAETKIDDLAGTLADQLACRGLTRAEALGMVRTWRKSWLESPGTRVLLPLPRRVADEVLPLEVSPAPRETVRVLVARLDILTPDEERRAEETARTAKDVAEAAKALGRWAVPVLRRVAKTSADPETARRAEALARELEPRR